jgi:hypothetical protein
MDPLRAASVAWYVTGRFYVAPDKSTQDLGYFLHLQGIQGHLFAGEPSEQTAFFTFRSEPFKARPVTNGDLSLGLDSVGDFTLYLKRQPGASFDKPHSFSDGEPIARFRRASVVMGTTLNAPSGTGLLSLNVFTATLIWSQEFEFGGSRYDLGRLIPHGITQWGDASTTQLAPAPHGFEKVFAFVGSAIALGR